MDVEADIRDFHRALGIHSQDTPGWPEDTIVALRARLICEEAREAVEALEDREPLADVAKELCDLIVVAVGAAVALGIPLEECWARVHASNMAKRGGPVREDGKVLKPAGWAPPDLAPLFPVDRVWGA